MTKSRDFLGPYRLARLIRQGSTCDVWEAVEESSQERFALKVLNNRFREDKAEIASLKFEYTVAKDLISPRIIRVLEYRVDSGTPFLVMELFSELNMKQALRRGPESLAFMLDKIVEQAAEGVYYLHTKGWIHRDIKPDNFLVSREGETKLIDFTIAEKKKTGLGKLFHRSGSTVQGTRSYMAPEQIQGKVCDERTDVYSFGCVLFEAVTGKPPYTGQTPNDLLTKHLNHLIAVVGIAGGISILALMVVDQPHKHCQTCQGSFSFFRSQTLEHHALVALVSRTSPGGVESTKTDNNRQTGKLGIGHLRTPV